MKWANILLILIGTSILSACAVTVPNWQANRFVDEFTEKATCRVERGTQHDRAFERSLMPTYFSYNFFAENHDGEIRAGIRSEPQIAITGDVQIKVGDKLFILTSADVPLDAAPAVPIANEKELGEAYSKTMEAITENIQKSQSPIRAFRGKRAQELLQAMIKTDKQIIFRVIGVNSALSATGRFQVDENFRAALKECDIL